MIFPLHNVNGKSVQTAAQCSKPSRSSTDEKKSEALRWLMRVTTLCGFHAVQVALSENQVRDLYFDRRRVDPKNADFA